MNFLKKHLRALRTVLTAAVIFCFALCGIASYVRREGDGAAAVETSRFEKAEPSTDETRARRTVSADEKQSAHDPGHAAGAGEREDGRIGLNSATSEQLQALKGIGPAKAAAIIEYRESYGGFKSVEELLQVKGIGEKTYEKLKDSFFLD